MFMSPWKPELDAIIGARHGGQVEHVHGLLQKLDARFPNVAEIAYQLAWTCDVLGLATEAIPHYERALTLGLAPNDHASALLGLGSTLRATGDALVEPVIAEAKARETAAVTRGR